MPPFPLFLIVGVLTLGVSPGEGLDGSAFDAGERATLSDALADPLALLELRAVPTSLLGAIVVGQIGPIHGAHVLDIPPDTALSAVALARGDGEPIPASSLRSFEERAAVRNEDAAAQAEDLAAMLG